LSEVDQKVNRSDPCITRGVFVWLRCVACAGFRPQQGNNVAAARRQVLHLLGGDLGGLLTCELSVEYRNHIRDGSDLERSIVQLKPLAAVITSRCARLI